MKILSIHFKNINSLAGENRISFTQAPFADTGVFAITGANGSGKSSVLDAITLALYGETFRFDQPAEFVMTQNTADSYAEVEFRLGDEAYQSSWRAERDLKIPSSASIKMQLTRVSNGEVLATTPASVCATITELTGMNFRTFTRSMLLAQGDFAAFLNALDSERMGILETLIATDIYADHRNEIISNAEKAQKSVDAVKQELAKIKCLTPEEQEASEHDLLDYQEQLKEFQDARKILEQQQSALKNTAALQIQSVDQKKRLQDLQAQLLVTGQSLGNIATAKQALIYKEDLLALDDKQKSLQHHKTEWNTLQNELRFLREQLGDKPNIPEKTGTVTFSEQHQTIDDIKFQINQTRLQKQSETTLLQTLDTQKAEKEAALETVQTWLDGHAGDESLLDHFPETARLKKLRGELKELTEQYKQFTSGSKKTSASIKNTRTALTKTHTDIAGLKEQLAADEQARNELLQGYPADSIDGLKSEQQERVRQFQHLYGLAIDYQKLDQQRGGWLGLFSPKPQIEIDIEALAQEQEQLRDIIKREENIKRALEESVYREALIKKLAIERPHLVAGKPCPLCGSKQHPYLIHPPVSANSVQALADQKIKMLDLSAKVEQLGKRIITAQKTAEKNRATQQQMHKLKAEWMTQCNRLGAASKDLDIANLRLMKIWLKEAQDELRNILSLGKQYQKKSARIAKITALIAKNEAATIQLQETAMLLDSNTQGSGQELQDLETALAQCRQEEQELAEKVLTQLASLGETIPNKGKEDAFFDRLNSRRQDYQTYFFRRTNLLEELSALSAQQAVCQAEITRCDRLINELIKQLDGEELIGVHLALIEKQQLIADKERVVSEQEIQFSSLKQTLLDTLAPTPFANLTELRNALQLLTREPEFTRRKTALQEQIIHKQQELANLAAEIDKQTLLVENVPGADDIYRQLTQFANKMDMTQLEIQRLQKHLAQQSQLLQRFDELEQELQQREHEAQPILTERALLDTENGMVFRRRVQLRLAEQLLAKTNRILEKISGRYYLRFDPEVAGLALEIEDTFQNNTRRQPKTLSGGESFIVSLALALGLSELANNNKSVDSLFIDEGFGNLDGDSLTLVLSTLENLRAYGKTVGVISHVDAVKKRIKTQVQMVKKPNGFGMLKKAS
ncbi:MAG: AAA family ATPase [Methylovulum sp.]|uniref:AAA family ATPase n=1 Tax=Methylovulum sp. TaxID=1916980 RepID=UPI00261EFA80|nr:AAA family ATPase [Methylovulum sp.]MDD2724356.1 AAA family ATPase [Methylovulum sp.]MDD5124809.1 AAA family ATPase [Methylovulum sp.]